MAAPATKTGAKIVPLLSSHTIRVKRLYRHGLKNLMNWVVWRDLWIEKGFELRARFDANKDIGDPRIIEKVVSEGEAELKEFTHPDPYTSARAGRAPICFHYFRSTHPSPLADARAPERSPIAVPHMPGGSKYMRHPFNSQGFPPEVCPPPRALTTGCSTLPDARPAPISLTTDSRTSRHRSLVSPASSAELLPPTRSSPWRVGLSPRRL